MAPRVRKKGGGNAENAIQKAVFQHLRTRGAPGIFAFHPKNGSKDMRGRRAGIHVGLGVEPGVQDVIVIKPELRGGFLCGQCYALELKTETGKTSDAQDACHEKMKIAGAVAGVAYGLDEALRWLESNGLLKGRVA